MKQLRASSVLFRFLANNKSLFLGLLIFVWLATGVSAYGATAEELRQKIETQNAKIADLEKEIALYESQLAAVSTQKKTLESEVSRLDISRKKFATDIAVTENKISAANLELEQLGGQIDDKESRIGTGKTAIEKSLVSLQHLGDATLVENLFASHGLTEAWEETDKLRQLQLALRSEIQELKNTKEELTVDYNEVEDKKLELSTFRRELVGQKSLLDQNRKEQATLLSQTKNKESEYQKILEAKRLAHEQFEQELSSFESALAYTLDPSKIPAAGSGVLKFPVPDDFLQKCKARENVFKNIYCISQYFGNTAFARSGAYDGKGHNGIDFATPTGTKISATLSGTVEAIGNTDVVRGCYSYGKWVLIRHSNGLSSLYGHLSYIGVSRGDVVPTGGLVGYSGNTGYSTGPHLHFTVYATDAVRVIKLGEVKAKSPCASVEMPVAPTEGYLNPLRYL